MHMRGVCRAGEGDFAEAKGAVEGRGAVPFLRAGVEGRRVCDLRGVPEGARARRSEAAKAKRLAWKVEGKCQECGKRWAEAGKTMCKPCLKALKDREKRNDPDHAKKYARRQARVDKGLCIDCGRKVEPGKKRCDRCRKMRRESEEKYRLKKKLAAQMRNEK